MNPQDLNWLAKARDLIFAPLPDEEEKLIAYLRAAVGIHGRAGYLLAEANSELDKAIDDCYSLQVPENRQTANARKAMVDGLVCRERERRDKIQSMVDAVELAVSSAQSILKQQRGERRMAE